MKEAKVKTDHGLLWTGLSEPPHATADTSTILFVHANSADSHGFKYFFEDSALSQKYKLLAFDLPGHGRSENAPDPERSYSQYAYAEAALDILEHYGIKDVIVFGWSLGGHVALELVSVLVARPTAKVHLLGAMITGTPPVHKQKMAGFRKDADLSALFNPDATKEDLIKTADLFMNPPPPEWLIHAILRADRRAGRMMVMNYMKGNGSDQIEIVQRFSPGWVAVANGGSDPLLDLDYVDEVCASAPRLWRGECIRVPGQGHAPFYDDPKPFDKFFVDFVNDCMTAGEKSSGKESL